LWDVNAANDHRRSSRLMATAAKHLFLGSHARSRYPAGGGISGEPGLMLAFGPGFTIVGARGVWT
jgi:hypothetical protein